MARPAQPVQTRKRRARGSITPEEVLRGALEICAAESVEALTMPHLAQYLDVGATSIYWYFRSKDDLLDALTTEAFKRLYAQMPPLEGKTWDDALRAYFLAFRSIMRADRPMRDLAIMRGDRYSDETTKLIFTTIDNVLQLMVNAGFSPDSATRAYFTLSVYTRGVLLVETQLKSTGSLGISPSRAGFAEGLPVLSQRAEPESWSMVSDDDYEFGLTNIIQGFRDLLATELRSAAGTRRAG
jgi:AcrR family transcriptional regulator